MFARNAESKVKLFGILKVNLLHFQENPNYIVMDNGASDSEIIRCRYTFKRADINLNTSTFPRLLKSNDEL